MSAYSDAALNAFCQKVRNGDVQVRMDIPGANTRWVGTLRLATDRRGNYKTYINDCFDIVYDGRTYSVWGFVRSYLKRTQVLKLACYSFESMPRRIQDHLDLIRLHAASTFVTLHTVLSTWPVEMIESDVVNGSTASASNSSASASASNSSASASASNSSASSEDAEDATVPSVDSDNESIAPVTSSVKPAIKRIRTTMRERLAECRELKMLERYIRQVKSLEADIAELRESLKQYL